MSHQPGAKAPAAADGSAGCQAPARPGCTEPVLRGTLGGVLHVDVLNPRRSRARVPGASRVVGKGRRMLVSPTVQSCPIPRHHTGLTAATCRDPAQKPPPDLVFMLQLPNQPRMDRWCFIIPFGTLFYWEDLGTVLTDSCFSPVCHLCAACFTSCWFPS